MGSENVYLQEEVLREIISLYPYALSSVKKKTKQNIKFQYSWLRLFYIFESAAKKSVWRVVLTYH